MQKLYALYIFFQGFLFPNHKDIKTHQFDKIKKEYTVMKMGDMPSEVDESSGLVKLTDTSYCTINDSGGENAVYEVNISGGLIKKHLVPHSKNYDWETLAINNHGQLFIGDVGNNGNKRKDLVVYTEGKKIPVTFPDQVDFPPNKENKNFDCEASIWYHDSLFFFSKNRGEGDMKIYGMADKGGQVSIVNHFPLKGMITGAAVSPDQETLLLLSYGHIYMFTLERGLYKLKPHGIIYFKRAGQSEAITFINNQDFLVTNEQGKIYQFKKK